MSSVEPQLPDVVAMIFADDIHQNIVTKKFSILNTYIALYAPRFPWTQTAFIVYLAFTDGHGSVPLTLRLIDADETRPPLFERQSVVHFPTPQTVREIAFLEPDVVFPEPGEYRLQLFSDGQFWRERQLFIWRASVNGQP